MLEVFVTDEIVPWRVFEGQFGTALNDSGLFVNGDIGNKLKTALQTRLTEHVT